MARICKNRTRGPGCEWITAGLPYRGGLLRENRASAPSPFGRGGDAHPEQPMELTEALVFRRKLLICLLALPSEAHLQHLPRQPHYPLNGDGIRPPQETCMSKVPARESFRGRYGNRHDFPENGHNGVTFPHSCQFVSGRIQSTRPASSLPIYSPARSRHTKR